MARMCKFLMQKKTKKKRTCIPWFFCSLKRPILKQKGALKWKSYNDHRLQIPWHGGRPQWRCTRGDGCVSPGSQYPAAGQSQSRPLNPLPDLRSRASGAKRNRHTALCLSSAAQWQAVGKHLLKTHGVPAAPRAGPSTPGKFQAWRPRGRRCLLSSRTGD